jgi:hypothetical protein
MPVNTAKVQGRRNVKYSSIQDVLADAERLSSGPVKALGNWSPGQIYRHLAQGYNASIDGTNVSVMPWYFLLIARLFRKKILAGPMPPGFKLPPDAAKTLVPGPTTTEEGLAELRAAVARLARESKRAKSPVFGDMTNEEWNQLHLNHSALHMSFLVPE